MTGTERLYKYCEDVEKGRVVVGKWIRLAVKRFRSDIKRSKTDKFPYYYDTEAADRYVQFCELLKLYQDEFAGKPLHLEPWQCFIMCQTIGWRHKETGNRRFNTGFCFIGRKSGKSLISSTLLIYDVLFTPGGQALCVATKRDQAKIVFDNAKNMIRQNEILSKRLKTYASTSRIVNGPLASRIEAMSAEADKFDGLSPSCVVADELAAMRDYSIIKILKSGMGARKDRLLFQITSGSDNLGSPGKSEFDRSCKLLDGIIEDDSYLPILFCLDEKDDWRNPKVWPKANPNIGVSLKEDFLIKACKEAQQVPALETEFRTKNCCQWLSPEHAWINYKYWQVCKDNASKYKLDLSKPYYANLALDLSRANDLTSLTLCVYQEGKYYMRHWLYFPIDSLDERIKSENEMWRKWLDDGLVIGVPGKTIDYDWLLVQIQKICEEYEISEALYDPYASNKVIPDLENSLTLVPIPQHLKSLSPFTKAYEKEILDGNIVDGNPVMAWCMSNAMVYTDANNNCKVIKNSRMGKDIKDLHVDPVITSLMTVGRIKSLLDAGEIDLRTPEESAAQLNSFLNSMKWG